MEYFIEEQLVHLAQQEVPDVSSHEAAQVWLLEEEARIIKAHPLPSTIESSLVEEDNGEFVTRLPKRLFDIFLSYSSHDAWSVVGLYRWLTSRHYDVYLDCFDPKLNPKVVDRATATILRKRMVQSRSLFVAASPRTPISAWVPWELGFTDGLTNKAAVLYIVPSNSVNFGRQSYFELYPEVGPGAGPQKPFDLQVSDPLATPPWSWDWGTWLSRPRVY